MNSAANSHSRTSAPRPWQSLLAGLLLASVFVYFWILPVFRPRGDFLWGYYRIQDIYFAVPVALTSFCVSLVLAFPKHIRPTLSLRLAMIVTSVSITFVVCDFVYAFGVMGALQPDFWLDRTHISRRYSVADSELGFVRKPLVTWRGYIPHVDRIVDYRTDQNGFRNAPGQERADIVFIGDSYTEAATVAEEETFVRRVARSTGLSVVNLGRGAYGPQQELIVLRRYGLDYEPGIVIWQLFEGNDLSDAEEFAEWVRNPRQVNTTLKERYINNSLLSEWLRNTRTQTLSGPKVTLRYHDGTTKRVALRYKYEPDEPLNRRVGMNETLSAIEAGSKFCEQQGIQLLIVFIPTMVRVLEPNISFDQADDKMRYLPSGVDSSQKDFSGTVEEFCNGISCNFVDSFDVLLQASTKGARDLYIPEDEHLDIGAHSVLADLIVDSIKSENRE